jgi:hypothetical protein
MQEAVTAAEAKHIQEAADIQHNTDKAKAEQKGAEAEAKHVQQEAGNTGETKHKKEAVTKQGHRTSSAAGVLHKSKKTIGRNPHSQKPSKMSDGAGKGDREVRFYDCT